MRPPGRFGDWFLFLQLRTSEQIPKGSALFFIHTNMTVKPQFKPETQVPIQPIPTAPMNVFPTLGSLQDVVELGESQLPITDKNELFALLMAYHNTLFKQVQRKP